MAWRGYHNISSRRPSGAGFAPAVSATPQGTQNNFVSRMVPAYFTGSDLYARIYAVATNGNIPGSTLFRIRQNGSATILDTDTITISALGPGNGAVYNLTALGVWTPGTDWFTIGWTPTTLDQGWSMYMWISDDGVFPH